MNEGFADGLLSHEVCYGRAMDLVEQRFGPITVEIEQGLVLVTVARHPERQLSNGENRPVEQVTYEEAVHRVEEWAPADLCHLPEVIKLAAKRAVVSRLILKLVREP